MIIIQEELDVYGNHKDEPKDPITYSNSFKIKCTFSGLRQFLATE